MFISKKSLEVAAAMILNGQTDAALTQRKDELMNIQTPTYRLALAAAYQDVLDEDGTMFKSRGVECVRITGRKHGEKILIQIYL